MQNVRNDMYLAAEAIRRLGKVSILVHAASPRREEAQKALKVSEGRITGESGEASFLLAYVMSFMLYFALLLYGIQVMSSVVEEKTSRIMEVLVSSLTPFQMLLGKAMPFTGEVAGAAPSTPGCAT